MMECLGSVFVPLSWAVDVVPALRHLPEGFPGVKFQTVARRCKEVTDTVTDAPYNFVKQRMAEGTHTPSFVSSLVEQCGGGPDGRTPLDQGEEDAIKLAAAILYAGGADTTVSIISCMVMAMVLYPEVQQRAQKELDEVLGEQRLPRLEDRERLPYVSAVVKESQRWHPVVPIGTAHATDEEIVYKGYRIPKGTYLVPQIWWFLHDPDVHRDPERFDPERFLPPRNEPDPNASFGYGRRVCPGRFVADDSLFMTISRILAVFHAGKQRGDEGREVECRVDLSGGLLSRPAPFAYDLRPRSEAHAELIRGLERECPWEKGDIDSLEPKVRELAAQPKFF
jgi:cytochrome P450